MGSSTENSALGTTRNPWDGRAPRRIVRRFRGDRRRALVFAALGTIPVARPAGVITGVTGEAHVRASRGGA
jgi:hypothetical protein